MVTSSVICFQALNECIMLGSLVDMSLVIPVITATKLVPAIVALLLITSSGKLCVCACFCVCVCVCACVCLFVCVNLFSKTLI